MATAHARYLAANEDLASEGHGEVPGRPHFTGVTLAERARAAGLDAADAWLSEGVGGGLTPREVVTSQLATVYHRSPLLSPAATEFAYAEERGDRYHAVLLVRTSIHAAGVGVVVFPGEGANDVPRSFATQGERPDPVPGLRTPGFPVSVHIPRAVGAKSAVVEEFELFDQDGRVVAARLVAPATNEMVFPSDVYLVPDAPLRDGSPYRVKARIKYGALQVERAWMFMTR